MRLRSTESAGNGASRTDSTVVAFPHGTEQSLLPEQAALVRKLQAESGKTFTACAVELGYVLDRSSNSEAADCSALQVAGLDPLLFMISDPENPVAEAARELRATLSSLRKTNGEQVRRIAMLNLESQMESAVLLANCAIACALSGQRILLIDADLANPAMHQLFNCPGSSGVWDLLQNKATAEALVQTTAVPSLDLIVTGTADGATSDLLEHSALALATEHICERYNLVLVNAGSADNQGISGSRGFDAALVSTRRNVTSLSTVRKAIDRLKISQENPVGTIVFD